MQFAELPILKSPDTLVLAMAEAGIGKSLARWRNPRFASCMTYVGVVGDGTLLRLPIK